MPLSEGEEPEAASLLRPPGVAPGGPWVATHTVAILAQRAFPLNFSCLSEWFVWGLLFSIRVCSFGTHSECIQVLCELFGIFFGGD